MNTVRAKKELLIEEVEGLKHLISFHFRFTNLQEEYRDSILKHLEMSADEDYEILLDKLDIILSKILDNDGFENIGIFHSDSICNVLIGCLQSHTLMYEMAVQPVQNYMM